MSRNMLTSAALLWTVEKKREGDFERDKKACACDHAQQGLDAVSSFIDPTSLEKRQLRIYEESETATVTVK